MSDHTFVIMLVLIVGCIVLISWGWYSERRDWKNKRIKNKGKEYRIVAKYSDSGDVVYIPQYFSHCESFGAYGWMAFSYLKQYNTQQEAQDQIDYKRKANRFRDTEHWVVKEPA